MLKAENLTRLTSLMALLVIKSLSMVDILIIFKFILKMKQLGQLAQELLINICLTINWEIFKKDLNQGAYSCGWKVDLVWFMKKKGLRDGSPSFLCRGLWRIGGKKNCMRKETVMQEGCVKVVGFDMFSFILFVGSFVLFSLYNDSSSL